MQKPRSPSKLQSTRLPTGEHDRLLRNVQLETAWAGGLAESHEVSPMTPTRAVKRSAFFMWAPPMGIVVVLFNKCMSNGIRDNPCNAGNGASLTG